MVGGATAVVAALVIAVASAPGPERPVLAPTVLAAADPGARGPAPAPQPTSATGSVSVAPPTPGLERVEAAAALPAARPAALPGARPLGAAEPPLPRQRASTPAGPEASPGGAAMRAAAGPVEAPVAPRPAIDPVAPPAIELPSPDLPRPSPPPPGSSARALIERAQQQLIQFDPGGCLATLDPLDHDIPDVQHVLGMCQMQAGHCEQGRATLEAYFRARGNRQSRLVSLIDEQDVLWCPIDAPPRSRWPERAIVALQWGDRLPARCRIVLDQVAGSGSPSRSTAAAPASGRARMPGPPGKLRPRARDVP